MPRREWTEMDEEASKQGKATRTMQENQTHIIRSSKGTKSAASPEGRLRLAR